MTRSCSAFEFFKCFCKCSTRSGMLWPRGWSVARVALPARAGLGERALCQPVSTPSAMQVCWCMTTFLRRWRVRHWRCCSWVVWLWHRGRQFVYVGSPPRKRLDPGDIATSQSGDEEVSDRDETMDSELLDNSFLSLRDQDSDRFASAPVASEAHDWEIIGCGCKKSNCYTNLDSNQLPVYCACDKKTPKKNISST